MKTARTNGTKLPDNLRPLFWSYHFESLDAENDKRTVIVQIINYGSWADWKWLIRTYGKKETARVVRSLPATELRPGALALASLLLGIKNHNYAFRSSH